MSDPLRLFTNRPLIKICGMRTQAALDAAGLCEEGEGGAVGAADFCGFIFHPQSPRSVTPELAGKLDSHGMLRVGVVVALSAPEAAQAARLARLDFLQLHGGQSRDYAQEARELARRSTGRPVGIIRVLWPDACTGPEALTGAMALHAPDTDLFLLDAGLSGGGSGRTLDWSKLAGLKAPRPWLLAGGLTPANARQAFAVVADGTDPKTGGAAGVDLNSGLEDRPGHKDKQAIRAALRALRMGI